jgi:hypothetical protein
VQSSRIGDGFAGFDAVSPWTLKQVQGDDPVRSLRRAEPPVNHMPPKPPAMQGADIMIDDIAAARAGLHEAVHRVLATEANAAKRPPAPGTDGVIGRAQFHYDCLGDVEAVALLEQMNLAVFRLRQALLVGAEADYQAQRAELKRLSGLWLYHAPLDRVADFYPAEGEA